MFSEGNCFSSSSAGSTMATGNGEGRNTEPWIWRLQGHIQPGAVS